MIVATAGHVDHGKTRLVEALTGVDTDRLEEERRRGLTIDLGFAYADWGGRRWGFVDVPGHERFVPNMLAGLTAVDLALLVVAADDGPMPQTREHLEILSLLGVSAGVAAITKTDAVGPDRVAAVRESVAGLLAPTPLAGAPIMPVSARTGEGVEALRAELDAQAPMTPPAPAGHFRLAIDRSFTVRGAGLVVTGTARAGTVREGDEVVIVPGAARARVRALRSADVPTSSAGAGERVAVNLAGVDRESVVRGQWLAAPAIARSSERLDAEVALLDGATLPRSGGEVYVHHGAAHRLARLVALEAAPLDGTRLVGLNLREPVHALHGDAVILRDAAGQRTLGGGHVLDPFPPRRGRRGQAHLAILGALRADGADAIAATLLSQTPLGVPLDELAARLNLDDEALAAISDAPGRRRLAHRGRTLLADADAWERLLAEIVATVDRWHGANPQIAGPRLDQLRAMLSNAPGEAQLRVALRELIDAGELVQDAAFIRRPDHAPRLADIDQPLWDRIQPLLAASPTQPPVVHNLAAELEAEPATLTALLERAAHAGHVLRVADNRFLLPAGVRELANVAAAMAAEAPDGLFEVREFRDRSGVGRNLSVDVLEYFDRMGLTRRVGDRRVVVRAPEEVFGG